MPNKTLTAPNNDVDKAMKQSSASVESQANSNEKELASKQPMVAREQAELDELKKDDNSLRRDLADAKSGVAAGVPASRMAAPAATPPPSPAPEPSRVNGGAIGGGISANEVVASASEATKAKPSASPTFVRPMTGQEQRQAIAQSETLTIGDVERRSTGNIIKTPNPKVMWRISAGSVVELSTDDGATWQGQRLRSFQPNPQITTGYAPTAKICWLVGRDGVILLTRDASHWVPIPPPITTDFVSVTATDNFSATVTAADGRRFSTDDAGDHWNPAP